MTLPSTDGTSALKHNRVPASPRLVSLAILKANWNDGRSYLDNFVPFVAECLRGETTPVAIKQVQISMRKTFGIRIPQHTLKTILSRAKDQGFVRQSDGLFHPDPAALARAIAPSGGEFVRCYTALLEQLRTYAKTKYGRELTESEAATALDAYVAEYGAPIVVQGVAAERDFDPAVAADPDVSFIVHAFVELLSAADPAGFQYLSTVVEGSMLTSVVYLPDIGAVSRKFKDTTTVYLDTPFLLRALGHLGPELAAPAKELLELIRQYGGSVACFEKTVAELRGVILHAARELGVRAPQGQNDILAWFVQHGLRRADVELIAAGLDHELARRGIRVLGAPAYTTTSDVDEDELAKALAAEVRYQRDQALHHDLDALTAIDRLRRGRHQPILEHCRAIFLTTNVNLVRAARRYFDADGQGFNWPPAILDTHLATLIWLKQPLKAPNLPRMQIMADCFAALRPSPAVWDRWMEEIARTEAAGTYSDDQLNYIRFSPDAQRTLMDLTFGDPNAIDQRTVAEVVAAAEAAITASVREELTSTQAKLRQEALARAAAEETLRLDRENRRTNLETRATAAAKRVGRVLFGALLLMFICGLVLALVGVSAIPGPHVPVVGRVLGAGMWLVSAVIGLAGMGWGIDAKRLVAHAERWLQPRLLSMRAIWHEESLKRHRWY